MERKVIMCGRRNDNDTYCEGVVAHQVSTTMIEVKRLNHKEIIRGKSWLYSGLCNHDACGHMTVIDATEGHINEENLRYKEKKQEDEPELDENGNPKPPEQPSEPERKYTAPVQA